MRKLRQSDLSLSRFPKLEQRLDRWFSCPTMDWHTVLAILTPLLVDQGFLVLMNLLNTAMISSSGVEAVSAVNMVDSLNNFLMNVFIAIATGGTVVVAQYQGYGDRKMVNRAGAQALAASVLLSAFIGILMILLHQPILSVLFGSAEEKVLWNARIYLIGSCASYPLYAAYQAVSGALRGVGETKMSLYLSLLLNLTAVVLNILLIVVLNLGIYGLVASMLLSRGVCMVVSIFLLLRRSRHFSLSLRDILQMDFVIQKKILLVGIPFAMEQIFFNGGKILSQIYIVMLGTHALTVNAICSSLSGLMQIPGNALSLAIVTVVGQCIGRGRVADAKKLTVSLIAAGSVSMLFLGFFIYALCPVLLPLFSPPAEIVETIRLIVLIIAAVQPFSWCTSFVLPSALRAAGDAKYTMVTSMLSMWLVRVILGYVLAIVLPFGITGVWCAMMFEWFIRSAIFGSRLHGSKWYTHRLIEDASAS